VPQAEVEGLAYIKEGKASSGPDDAGAEEDIFDDSRQDEASENEMRGTEY
jgi:hypothetical protein